MVPNPSSLFFEQLSAVQPPESKRRWLYIPYDQLSDQIGPLAKQDPGDLGIVMLESPWKASRRPYHKQKLALVLASQRHFALEQARRGVAVDYRVVDGTFGEALMDVAEQKGGLTCMRPAERELRVDCQPVVDAGWLEWAPHEGWLTEIETLHKSHPKGAPWRMDSFYRMVRREGNWLMDEDGKPTGGRFSFDGENREAWKGDPLAAQPPIFPPDAITQEVVHLIEEHYADHPGALDATALPVTAKQVGKLWEWAKSECMPFFGPYEDAMSVQSTNLFHTRVAPLVHLHRLLPREVVEDVLELPIELRCKEGFLRQVLGWREFVHHIHEVTDGFRNIASSTETESSQSRLDEGAQPNFLQANEPLPPTFWGEPSGLNCLDNVIDSVWAEGYSHHITRLMVLSNIATLLDVSPRELTDWFWVAYTDAYDWVVEPNVLAMGTFATGPLMTTKPYISGAAYIHRMSDYCSDCAFHPKNSCPITPLYWSFLDRHQDSLRKNNRLRMPYASLAKRAPERRERDLAILKTVQQTLRSGRVLSPDSFGNAQ